MSSVYPHPEVQAGSNSYTYDALGNLVSQKDAKGSKPAWHTTSITGWWLRTLSLQVKIAVLIPQAGPSNILMMKALLRMATAQG